MLGWANASVSEGRLRVQPGCVSGKAPRDAAFEPALEAEVTRLRAFLGAG